MWKYRIGMTLRQIEDACRRDVSQDEVERVLRNNTFEFSVITPSQTIATAIPSVLDAIYKNPSIMRSDAPDAFSCSSLVSYLYTLAGVWMPSISVDKYVFGTPIRRDELRFGDLIFVNSGIGHIYTSTVEYEPGTPVPEGVDHVGMYIGERKVIHANKQSGGVSIEDADSFGPPERIVGYRRIADLDEQRFLIYIPEERPLFKNPSAFLEFLKQELGTRV